MSAQNVIRLAGPQADPDVESPAATELESPADRSGHAIISLLRQAVDVAKKNEERARARAEQFATELDSANNRIQDLEEHVRYFHARAERAEKWLARIHSEIQVGLIEPLMNQHAR